VDAPVKGHGVEIRSLSPPPSKRGRLLSVDHRARNYCEVNMCCGLGRADFPRLAAGARSAEIVPLCRKTGGVQTSNGQDISLILLPRPFSLASPCIIHLLQFTIVSLAKFMANVNIKFIFYCGGIFIAGASMKKPLVAVVMRDRASSGRAGRRHCHPPGAATTGLD
jgi:hypothetical protein